jgi:hypothetical protein
MPGFAYRGGRNIDAPIAPPPPNNLTNQYNLYNSGVAQNAEDYGDIMGGYRNLRTQAANTNPLQRAYTPQPMTPQTVTDPGQVNAERYAYKPSADVTASLAGAKELSQTGGYSAAGIQDLRERGISPIRAVYAGANRDIDRGRALAGGYSPNYNAAKAKMAREMSDQISGAVTNVNAGIAQNVAGNRLSATGTYGNLAGEQSRLENDIGMRGADSANQANLANIANRMRANEFNAGATNQANQFNINNQNEASRYNNQFIGQNQDTQLRALQGMQSMYGTTPAMSSLFGNQALQHAQLQNQITQENARRTNDMVRPIFG